MKITSAKFLRGVAGTNEILEDGVPQVAIVGRSNVGKSTIINALVGQKELARTSASPGHTQELNVYWINESLYLIDLPGYGYAEGSSEKREKIQKLVNWYLFDSSYVQKIVVLIVDANVGATKNDIEMLRGLREHNKRVVVVANKIDKMRYRPTAVLHPGESRDPGYLQYETKLLELQKFAGDLKVIPFSSGEKIGIGDLTEAILEQF